MKRSTVALLRKKEQMEAERTERFGPPPINPFKQLRLDHGFTHSELCSQVYISKQAIIRLEQGTYTNPLPTVLTWWGEHHCASSKCPSNQSDIKPGQPIGELYLRDAYAEFQQNQRARYFRIFGVSLVFNDNELRRIHDERYHPFRILRERANFSLTEVARSLCLPQATLEHFEKKFRTQQCVPKALRSVLREIGYATNELNEFEDEYMQFRNGGLRFRVVSMNDSCAVGTADYGS
jgi:hypothetical protein